MRIESIKQNLKFGDTQFIAKKVNKSKDLVNKVLAGQRNNDDVLKVAQMVAENNISLSEQIDIMLQHI